jgi:DNA polymerase-1
MNTIYFDIETNPLTDWMHLSDLKEVRSFGLCINDGEPFTVTPEEGIEALCGPGTIVGHNIIGFDLPALTKLYGFGVGQHRIFDTAVASRLLHTNLADQDYRDPTMPKELVGLHSLKAWGHRLRFPKTEGGDFTAGPMLDEYCRNDVALTRALHKHLGTHPSLPGSTEALDIEMLFAQIIKEQERAGITFDVKAAERLHAELRKRMLEIEQEMQKMFPPIVQERISEKTNKILKPKVTVFNPGSRLQIAERLKMMRGWEPTEFTPDGRPRVDESVLAALDYPEAAVLAEYLTLGKRIGQLADGDEAWLRVVTKAGKIHGRVNTNGALTGRCTHSRPNMAQVPTDPEYRKLFVAPPGMVMVGVDASGLELRCLAHYLGAYDNGEYAKAVTTGDIHWTNAQAFGLAMSEVMDKNNSEHKKARNQAKGAIYALIYGAGNEKLGLVLGGSKRTGANARANFEAKVPAYLKLKETVSTTIARRGWIKGIDGRPLYPRSEHAALNTLLQSAGAVVMKQACIIAYNAIDPNRCWQVAAVHDEYQFVSTPEYAHEVGSIVVDAIRKAGKGFNFRCPLDGEYRIGANWAETH